MLAPEDRVQFTLIGGGCAETRALQLRQWRRVLELERR
jgi:hypothetical protein